MTPSGLAALTSGGASENTQFAQKVRSEPNPQLNAFLDYGGIVCQWGDPAGEASCVLAESTITEAQKASQRAALMAQGWKQLSGSEGDEAWGLADLSTSTGNDPRTIFRGDKWIYALDESCLDYLA